MSYSLEVYKICCRQYLFNEMQYLELNSSHLIFFDLILLDYSLG
jgi:hypothetical protein